MKPLSLLIAMLAAVSMVTAARDVEQDEALQLRQQGKILALEQIMVMVGERYPGYRLLEVELEKENHLYVYEVEFLTRDGIARELEIDAHRGTILSDKEDD